MVKQARLASGVMPLSTIKPPTTRVDPNDDEVVEVTPNVSFSVLAKRKCDEGARVLGRKKSRTSFSFCALKEVVGLMSGSGRPSTAGLHDLPSAPLVVQAVAHVPSTPFSLPAQEVFVSPFTMTSLIVPLVAPVVVSASTIIMPLLSADVMTAGALEILPLSSSASPVPTLFVLALALPSSFSCPQCLPR